MPEIIFFSGSGWKSQLEAGGGAPVGAEVEEAESVDDQSRLEVSMSLARAVRIEDISGYCSCTVVQLYMYIYIYILLFIILLFIYIYMNKSIITRNILNSHSYIYTFCRKPQSDLRVRWGKDTPPMRQRGNIACICYPCIYTCILRYASYIYYV